MTASRGWQKKVSFESFYTKTRAVNTPEAKKFSALLFDCMSIVLPPLIMKPWIYIISGVGTKKKCIQTIKC